ncbi:MAG: CPBP family intramembrane metalloprotease [Planctomycetaceae bacterium]|nr:CPBP family intramembrane metalloprotease [Planctomycetaceae bacterium]
MKSLYSEIAVILFAIIFPTALTFVYFVFLAGETGSIQKAAFAVGKIIQFALPVFWVAVICKERLFKRTNQKFNPKLFVISAAFGIAVFAALLLLYQFVLSLPGGGLADNSQAVQIIKEKISGFGITDWRAFLLLGIFYSVIHSGLEEYYWRWFVFGRLNRFLPFGIAAVVSSLGFMSHHVVLLGTYFGYTSVLCWLGSLGVAVGGLFWCRLCCESNSVREAWFSHGIIDAAIFTVGAMICF